MQKCKMQMQMQNANGPRSAPGSNRCQGRVERLRFEF
jgi:hypothetical protein